MAIFTTVCAKCGGSNFRGTKFCRHCGEARDALWRTCSKCSAINLFSGSVKFCAGCGAPFTVVSAATPDTVSTVWVRAFTQEDVKKAAEGQREVVEADPKTGDLQKVWRPVRKVVLDFARREEIEDLKGAFKGGVIVDHGTKALLLLDGKLVETLGPGRYSLDSDPVNRIRWAGDPQHASVILVESGDVRLEEMRFEGLLARDDIAVEVRANISLRLSNLERFLSNVLHGKDVYEYTELRRELFPGIRDAFSEAVRKYDALALNSDLAVKQDLEACCQRHLAKMLERLGLEFVQLETFVPDNPQLAALRKERGDLVLAREKAKALQQWRDLKVEDLRSEKTAERVRREIESNDTLDAMEKKKLLEVFAEDLARAQKDKAYAWVQFRERADLEHKLALQRIDLIEKLKLRGDALAMEIDQRRAGLEGEMAARRLKEVEGARIDLDKAIVDVDRRLREAKGEVEIESLKLEMERKKSELGMLLRKQRIDQDEAQKWEESKRKMAEGDAEIARLRSMSEKQLETYLASDPERAKVLIARAQADAAGGAAMKEVYERMLAVQQKGYERGYEMVEKVVPRITAGVTPIGAGYGGVPGGMMGAGGSDHCPTCHVEVVRGSKHCGNCGHKFF
ncbi:MAG: hypothetical protein HYY93_06040 [Planctomycetes bacterium]|nr:hypothetical protein [Planctomycetota bacterium]